MRAFQARSSPRAAVATSVVSEGRIMPWDRTSGRAPRHHAIAVFRRREVFNDEGAGPDLPPAAYPGRARHALDDPDGRPPTTTDHERNSQVMRITRSLAGASAVAALAAAALAGPA